MVSIEKLKLIWLSMRPHQWLKNLFILSGLIFGHKWTNSEYVLHTFLAITAFIFVSSAGYIFNDWLDQKTDAKHPQKKYRPIAAGKLTIQESVSVLLILLLMGLGLGFYISLKAFAILISYCFLTVAYSLKLKNIPWLEMLCIVMGFMLRILLGTSGIDITPSVWVICCGFLLTLFLILAKRRSEQLLFQGQPEYLRTVLGKYKEKLLGRAVYFAAFMCFLVYAFYAIAHGFNLTILLVALGIGRYLFLLRLRGLQGVELDVASEFFQDKILQAIVVVWLLLLLWYTFTF